MVPSLADSGVRRPGHGPAGFPGRHTRELHRVDLPAEQAPETTPQVHHDGSAGAHVNHARWIGRRLAGAAHPDEAVARSHTPSGLADMDPSVAISIAAEPTEVFEPERSLQAAGR